MKGYKVAKKDDKINSFNEMIAPVFIDFLYEIIVRHIHECGVYSVEGDCLIPLNAWPILLNRLSELSDCRVRISTSERLIYVPIDKGIDKFYKQQHCVFCLLYELNIDECYNGIDVGNFRYNAGKYMKALLPTEIWNKIDAIIPIPMSGVEYAKGLSDETGILICDAITKTVPCKRSFNIEDSSSRKKVIRESLHFDKEKIKNRNFVVVDEAIFTGMTMKFVCENLKDYGANKVYICIPSPASISSCNNYMQPKRNALLNYIRYENLLMYFRADGIFFQNVSDFRKYLLDNNEFCLECFGGIK